MTHKKGATMAADDARQYMLRDSFEIYEKSGIPSGAMEMHFHNFYEVMHVTEGEFAVLLNDTTYHLKPGDFLLIDQNQLHHYQYVEKRHDSCHRLLMWISRDYLEQLSGTDGSLISCFLGTPSPAWHFPSPSQKELDLFLEKLQLLSADNNFNKSELRLLENSYLTLFFVLLNQLCRHPEYSFLPENTSDNPMIEALTSFVQEHITETITLDMLAKQAGLSKYHFIRIFKEMTGTTVHDFITQKRIIMACEKIWEGEPLNTLYQSCGFADYSSFYRNFKAIYGISPREFKTFYEKSTKPTS